MNAIIPDAGKRTYADQLADWLNSPSANAMVHMFANPITPTNATVVTDFVDQAARNDRSISFIMLDIDHFKRVNDDHGHLVGDRVLAEVARRCLHAVRSSDIVCRFGGEEFVIMLPETAEEGALLLCERILDEIKDKPIIVDDAAFKMTASLGLAVSRSPVALGTEEILRRADQAMYEAKRAGRCRVHRFEDRPEASVD